MLRTLDSIAAVAEKSEAATRFKGVLSEVQREYHVLHSLRLWSWTPSPSMFDLGWRNLPAKSPFTAPSPRLARRKSLRESRTWGRSLIRESQMLSSAPKRSPWSSGNATRLI